MRATGDDARDANGGKALGAARRVGAGVVSGGRCGAAGPAGGGRGRRGTRLKRGGGLSPALMAANPDSEPCATALRGPDPHRGGAVRHHPCRPGRPGQELEPRRHKPLRLAGARLLDKPLPLVAPEHEAEVRELRDRLFAGKTRPSTSLGGPCAQRQRRDHRRGRFRHGPHRTQAGRTHAPGERGPLPDPLRAQPLPHVGVRPRHLAFLAVNDAAVEHYGYSRDEFLAMTLQDIRPSDEASRLAEDVAAVAAAEYPPSPGTRRCGSTGRRMAPCSTWRSALPPSPSRAWRARLVLAKPSRAPLEEQLRHAQKMDAVGTPCPAADDS